MKFTRLAIGLALAGLSFGANATNGYFSHGYGMKAKGMAGASTTNTEDAFFGANNPAAAAFVGNRIDLGADIFTPIREATSISGPFGNVSVESESNVFLIPEFGYSRVINPSLTVGVSVYGNGGMNTDYPAVVSTNNILGGSGALGVDLMQLVIAPTAAYKIAPSHSIGVSPLLGYQRFEIYGVDSFGSISNDNSKLSNNGFDNSFGYGNRIGYLGKLTSTVTIGAAYASKMNFEEFDKYSGMFAEQGDFDIPENYNLGIAWQATPQIKLALDYQRINYSDVAAVGNPANNFTLGPSVGYMGLNQGAGFGWSDMDVWKLGIEYKYNNQWTLRAGYSHSDMPMSGSDTAEVTFNILAPAVIEDHITLGFTYTLSAGNELTVAYMHGFDNDVSGARPASFGAGTDTIKMHQDLIGISYSWKM